MIWNDATDVRFNGSTVQAVYCNNTLIWPPMTAAPDAWTMLYVSSYHGTPYASEFGFSIYDATNRKVYTTDGMHPVSSYELSGNMFGASASGVSPFRMQFSASGIPYNVMRMTRAEISDSQFSTPVFSGSGSFISGSGTLKDSLKDSATFPTSMDYSAGYVSRMDVHEYEKRIWVYGSAVSQFNSAANAAMFLFVPTPPTAAVKGGGPFSATSEVPTSYTSGINAGYFEAYGGPMVHKDTALNAFDMFNGIEHSGDVYVRAKIKDREVIMTAYNNSDSCTLSLFPSTLVNYYALSGGSQLNPTSVAIATEVGIGRPYGSFSTAGISGNYSYEQASTHAYVGAYCTENGSGKKNGTLKCKETALAYTASTYIP